MGHPPGLSGLPPELRVVWVSPRKTVAASHAIAANVVGSIPLHEALASVKLSLDEFVRAHLVIMEVPPASHVGLVHQLLRLVSRIRALGPHVAIVVQPNLRRQTQQPYWVQRWNKLTSKPFEFVSACSCMLGDGVPGCHNGLVIGTSFAMPVLTCNHVPTSGGTPTAMRTSLEGVLRALCVHFLVNNDLPGLDEGCEVPAVSGSRAAEADLPEASNRTNTASCSVPVPQRTPDSALPTTSKTSAYPTDSKEREKQKRKEQKEKGEEIIVKKRKFHVEDHYDDCGEDLSSLDPRVDQSDARFVLPCDYDTDQELSDQDHNECLLSTTKFCYPIDITKIAQPTEPGEPFRGRDPRAPKPMASKCPGCSNYRNRDDWEHTRVVGECGFPRDKPFIPQCIGCQDRQPRLHEDHTYEKGKCRFSAQGARLDLPGPKRPHNPQPRHDDEPTAHAPATRDGVELGASGEERVARADRAAAAASSSSASSSSAGPAGSDPAQSSGGRAAEAGQGRGPDHEPRTRRTFRDEGDNPENPDDWTNFDIGKVVRLFRTGRESAIRLSLRKLHVRWWHASKDTMHKFLERVGVSDAVLRMIPEICETCRVCREWTKPGPSNVCSTEFADTFNQQVECDLLFIGKHTIFHMLDRCTRWHAAVLVPGKDEETLMQALDTVWFSTHGAPKELIVDGESGITVSAKTTAYLARKGTKLHTRAKDQHARFVERRGALLRDTVHRVQSQLRQEGISDVPFHSVLSEAVFAGNAMLTVNGSTPYNAVYGRVPRVLPGIDQVDNPNSQSEPSPGMVRHTHRLREISVQAMIEGSARARLGRTNNTRTTMAAQQLDLRVGEEVDFFRAPNTKDASGWYGPAEVADVSRIIRGIVTVRWQSRLMEVQLSHIRRHLHFLTLLAAPACLPQHYTSPWDVLTAAVDKLTPGTHRTLGAVLHRGTWESSSNTVSFPGVFHAAQFLAENHLHIPNVVAVRLSNGVKDLPSITGYSHSVVMLWRPGRAYQQFIELEADPSRGSRAAEAGGGSVLPSLRLAAHDNNWPHVRAVQFLTVPDASCIQVSEEVGESRAAEPDDLQNSGHAAASSRHSDSFRPSESSSSSGRLSTIPEESYEDTLDAYFCHDDPQLQKILEETKGLWE